MRTLIVISFTALIAWTGYTSTKGKANEKSEVDYAAAIAKEKSIAKKATSSLRTAVAYLRNNSDTIIKEVPITKVNRVVERVEFHDTIVKYVKIKETKYTGNKYLGMDKVIIDTL